MVIPWVPKKLAFAPLEVLNKGDPEGPDAAARLRQVPTRHPDIDLASILSRYPHLKTLHSDYAAHAATCTVAGSNEHPSAFFLARAIEDATILELRWLRSTGLRQYYREGAVTGPEDEARLRLVSAIEEVETPPAPELFQLPAPLLGNISIFIDALSDTLQVLAVTVTGYLYRFTFSAPDLFHARSLGHGWVSEHRIANLSGWDERGNFSGGRLAQKVHVVDAGLVLVGCSDGTLIKLEQQRRDESPSGFEDAWDESVLQPTSPFRTLSRLFGRGAEPMQDTDGDRSSPTQPLSISSHISDKHSPVAFVISPDRKLRIWDLITDACIRTIDLPEEATSSNAGDTSRELSLAVASQEGQGSASQAELVFGPDARPLMEVIQPDSDDQSGHDLYLVVHVPRASGSGNFFVYYGLELASVKAGNPSSALGNVVRLWDARCDFDTRSSDLELRDVALLPFGITGMRLWALWDDNGSPLLKYINVVDDHFDTDASTISLGSHSGPAMWNSVSTWRPHLPLHGPEFEESLAAIGESKEQLVEFFLERLFEAGRFSARAIEASLAEYEESLLASFSGYDFLPPALSQETHFANLEEHLATVVGCSCSIATDSQTGNPLTSQYISNLKREWMKILGLMERFERSARWPVGLVRPTGSLARANIPSAFQAQPSIMLRDYVSTLVVEDAPSVFLRIAWQIHSGTAVKPSRRALFSAEAAAAEQAYLSADTESASKSRALLSALLSQAEDSSVSLFGLTSTAVSLSGNVPAGNLESFRAAVREIFSKPPVKTIEDVMGELWDDSFEEVTGSESFQFLSESCQDLGMALDEGLVYWSKLLSETIQESDRLSLDQRRHPETELEAACLADAIASSLQARRASASLLSFLLSSIWVSGGIETNVPSMSWLMASAVTTLQTCSALLNIADLDGRPDSVKVSLRRDDSGGDADDMASQFEGMDMSSRQARSKPLIGPTISPLHYAVQQGLFASSIVDPEGEDNDMSADAIAARNSLAALHAVFAEATHTGSTPLPALTPTLARLTCGLVQAGFAEAARLIVETLPPALASAYIKGGIALAHGPQNAAVSFFNKVCSALRSPDILAEDISGLITILPPQVTAKAPGEHSVALLSKHLCHLFSVAPFTEAVAYFGAQAIQKGIDSALAHDSNAAQEVWFRTFRAQLDLWDFKSAYRTIMMSEDDQFRRDCIRSLVTAMCEAGEVSTLLHYNFSGLQGEIERSLSFKARNSDPFGRPNYFKILYAYHMHRGDLKSAGAVMYQQSHQLAELQRMGYHIAVNKGSDYEEFVDIASVQARSFLAAMNVLNLVDKQDAWFPYAHPTAGGAVDEQDEMQMSQEHQQESIFNDIARQKRAYTKCRTTHYIPSSEFAPECKEIEILELDDIKREYQLLLARLDLAKGYTELTAPRSKLSAFDAVALYLRSDQYDKAVSAARALDVDMTAIFQNLATKCTSLTRRAAAWKTELSASAASNHDEKKEGTGAAIHPSLQKLQEEIDSQEDPDAAFLLYSERSSSWTGSPSDKAWRYLRLQLEMNDEETAEGRGGDAGAGGKYRIVVLNRILDLGAEVFLPEWLVEWFRDNKPDLLIRAYLRVGLIERALQESLSLLNKPLKASARHKHQQGAQTRQDVFIPYMLIDELLLVAEDPSTVTPYSSSNAKGKTTLDLRALAAQVKSAVQSRVERVEHVQKEAVRADDTRNREVERRSQQGQQQQGSMEWIPAA